MKNITAKEHFGYAVTVRKLVEGYTCDKETGEIRCFGGKLNPRPSYQREFVYSAADQSKVFSTLKRAFPLGIMYWCDAGDGTYELVDGQQRTLSICHIIDNDVALEINGVNVYFRDLPESEKEQILDQELLIFICIGNLDEKMEWFSTINIVGKELTAQELRSKEGIIS